MGYIQRSRSLAISLLFVLPLLIAYEIWLTFCRPSIVNAAGEVARLPVRYFSAILGNVGSSTFISAALLFNIILGIVFVVAYIAARKQGEFQPSMFLGMLLEAGLYGLLLGYAAAYALRFLPAHSANSFLAISPETQYRVDRVMLSVGAGVYEEILFRLFLVGGLYLVGILIFEKNRLATAIGILIAGSLFCAAIKELATPADAFTWQSFVARMIIEAPLFAGLGLLVFSIHCGLIWLAQTVVGSPAVASACVSIVIGSLLFSLFHHVGSLGDPLEARIFLFRFAAGLVLSVLYQLRGLGVAVYTHAFYDILVVVKSAMAG